MDSENALPDESQKTPKPSKTKTASHFFIRGLAVSLPTILTIVVLLWVANAIYGYVIEPVNSTVRYTIAWFVMDTRPTAGLEVWEKQPRLEHADFDYRVTSDLKSELEERLENEKKDDGTAFTEVPAGWVQSRLEDVYIPYGDEAVPYLDYRVVAAETRPEHRPKSATQLYKELVTYRYFKSMLHLSAVGVLVTIVLMYFLGRLVTVRLGAWGVNKFETVVLGRLPLVSNVYGSVKQVTDFLFTERTVEYNRVVALEYPRRGLWSIGFVTGDYMLEITSAAGEPMLAD